jgi:hypothetical protein
MRDPTGHVSGVIVVQRRRKPRSKPRDVFSKSAPPQKRTSPEAPKDKPSKTVSTPPVVTSPTEAAPSAPLGKGEGHAEVSDEVAQVAQDTQSEGIVGEQLIREPRKGIGLKQSEAKETTLEESDLQTSKRAQDIIDKSKARASEHQRKAVPPKQEEKLVKAPVKRRRRVKPSFQPAERKRRLDRSRHMEYKYEVRRLLIDINVAEEHRSSILGSVWAKGERQTVGDAKEFLSEKHSEGILDDGQLDAMTKVVDSYTVRR